MRNVVGRYAVTGAFLLLVSAGCAIGETTYETVTLPARVAKTTRTCESPFVAPHVSSLKACGGGKGHCYAADKVPIQELDDCGGGEACVPDKLLALNGGTLKSCTFFMGGPGACMSLLVKDINANKDALKQDVCDPDERCAPCTNPLDKSNTHLCEPNGVHEKACVGGPGAEQNESCCHGAGICALKDGLPADAREDMSRDSCPGDQLCAPAALVDGKPVKCDVAGVSGVCLDLCFAKMLQGTSKFMRGGCRATEVCLPCALGKSRGMPGC